MQWVVESPELEVQSLFLYENNTSKTGILTSAWDPPASEFDDLIWICFQRWLFADVFAPAVSSWTRSSTCDVVEVALEVYSDVSAGSIFMLLSRTIRAWEFLVRLAQQIWFATATCGWSILAYIRRRKTWRWNALGLWCDVHRWTI